MHKRLCPPEIKQQRAVVSRVSAATTSASPSVSPRSSIGSPRYYHMTSDATVLLDLIETGGSSNSSSTESRGAAVMPCHQADGPLQWVAGDDHCQVSSPSTFQQPQHQRRFVPCCNAPSSAPLPPPAISLSSAHEEFAVTPLPVCRSGVKLNSAMSQPCCTIAGPPKTMTHYMAKFPDDGGMETSTAVVSSGAQAPYVVEDAKNLTPLNEARAHRRYSHYVDRGNDALSLPHQMSTAAVLALPPGTQGVTRKHPPFKNETVKLPPQPVMSGRKVQYRKTRVCPWFTSGRCLLGDRCNYAHSKSELRGRPDLTRTRMCSSMDTCMDPECRFAHGSDELRATGAFFRTKLCKFWQRGSCPAGIHCRHAHGEEQLRDPADCSAPLAMVPHESRVLAHHLDRHQNKQQLCPSTPAHSRWREPQQELQCSKQKQNNSAVSLPLLDLSSTEPSSRTRTQSAVSTVSGDSPLMDLNSKNSIVLDEALRSRSRHSEEDVLLEVFTQLLLDLAPQGSPREKITSLSSTTAPPSVLKTAATTSISRHPCRPCCATDDSSPGDVKLKDILNLAVSSQDPELLECSAKLLRASLALRSTSTLEYPWTNSCHRDGPLVQPSSRDLAIFTTYSTPASPRHE